MRLQSATSAAVHLCLACMIAGPQVLHKVRVEELFSLTRQLELLR